MDKAKEVTEQTSALNDTLVLAWDHPGWPYCRMKSKRMYPAHFLSDEP